MHLYLASYQWRDPAPFFEDGERVEDDPHWGLPSPFVIGGSLDFRTLPEAGQKGGIAPPKTLWALSQQDNNVGGAYLGEIRTEDDFDLPVRRVVIDEIERQYGLGRGGLLSSTFRGIITEFAVLRSDPTGQVFSQTYSDKGLVIGDMVLDFGSRWFEARADAERRDVVLAARQNDYRKLRERSLAGNDTHTYRKYLDWMTARYGMPPEAFIAKDLPTESPEPRDTTISDDFSSDTIANYDLIGSGTWTVTGGELQLVRTSSGSSRAVHKTNLSTNDHFCEWELDQLDGGSSAYQGPICGYQDDDNFYYARAYLDTGGNRMEFFKEVASSSSQIGADISPGYLAAEVVRLDRRPDETPSLELFRAGLSIGTRSDSDLSSGVRIGIQSRTQGGGTNQLDNLLAEDFPTATPETPSARVSAFSILVNRVGFVETPKAPVNANADADLGGSSYTKAQSAPATANVDARPGATMIESHRAVVTAGARAEALRDLLLERTALVLADANAVAQSTLSLALRSLVTANVDVAAAATMVEAHRANVDMIARAAAGQAVTLARRAVALVQARLALQTQASLSPEAVVSARAVLDISGSAVTIAAESIVSALSVAVVQATFPLGARALVNATASVTFEAAAIAARALARAISHADVEGIHVEQARALVSAAARLEEIATFVESPRSQAAALSSVSVDLGIGVNPRALVNALVALTLGGDTTLTPRSLVSALSRLDLTGASTLDARALVTANVLATFGVAAINARALVVALANSAPAAEMIVGNRALIQALASAAAVATMVEDLRAVVQASVELANQVSFTVPPRSLVQAVAIVDIAGQLVASPRALVSATAALDFAASLTVSSRAVVDALPRVTPGMTTTVGLRALVSALSFAVSSSGAIAIITPSAVARATAAMFPNMDVSIEVRASGLIAVRVESVRITDWSGTAGIVGELLKQIAALEDQPRKFRLG